jgi:alkylhydroperoxidase family enzyme
MARIPYATQAQYEQLMRDIRLPEDTARKNAFRMLAHSPAVGGSVLRLIFTILAETDLDFCLLELVVLRVSQRSRAQYAWEEHAAVAKAIGVSDAQIAALERGDASGDIFTRRERIVLAFTDEVLDSTRVSADTFARAREEFSARDVVDLLLTIGYFRMITGMVTTLDIELDAPRAEELPEMACEVA